MGAGRWEIILELSHVSVPHYFHEGIVLMEFSMTPPATTSIGFRRLFGSFWDTRVISGVIQHYDMWSSETMSKAWTVSGLDCVWIVEVFIPRLVGLLSSFSVEDRGNWER